MPAYLPDRLNLSHGLTLEPGGLLPTIACSLWGISIAFELVIGSKTSNPHYYTAGFKMTPFRFAGEAALTRHLRIQHGHKEDRLSKK